METFKASVWKEDGLFVAQCLEVDLASQGDTEEQALENLTEALELHFAPPTPSKRPKIATIEVRTGAA
jgi:predicted RNase H-like HicB family nuclease